MIKVMEYACGIGDCEICSEYTGDTYDVLATCENCGDKHIARIILGHPLYNTQDSYDARECPYCLVGGMLKFGTSAQARKLMKRVSTPRSRRKGRVSEENRDK